MLMTELKYMEIDEKNERKVLVTIRGRNFWFSNLTDMYNLVGRRKAQNILKVLDDDLNRFSEVIDIVDEVANYIFRGKCEKSLAALDFSTMSIIICRFHFKGFFFNIEFLFSVSNKQLIYNCLITMELIIYIDLDEITKTLLHKFLEELAEIFEAPEMKQFEITKTVVVIYLNERRFRLYD
jgi:hypothetical protein